MIGKPGKLGTVQGIITGYASLEEKLFLIWLKLSDEEEISLTGKQLKQFLQRNKI